MISTRPAAYVRKSHKDAASADAQLDSIKELAIRQGVVAPLKPYIDDGRSGRHGKRGAKSHWRRLHDDIAAGNVTLVYVTALDRAGRSLREWLDFTALCVEHHVEVRDQSGQDRASGDNEDIAIIEMMMAQREGRKAVERSARGRETQARRGDEVYQGRSPYGWMRVRLDANGDVTDDPKRTAKIVEVPNPDQPMQPLIDAITATKGNVLQAARLLGWEPKTLSRALDRTGVQRARQPRNGGRRRAAGDAPLSRLVECHCGTLMTPARDRRTKAWASLYCSRGHKEGVASHGRSVARSRHVYDALKRQIPRRSSAAILKAKPDTAKRRAELEAERERLGWAVADGLLTREKSKARAAKIAAELDTLADIDNDWVGVGPLTPNVRWDADDATLGEDLRRHVRVVRLGDDMLPVEVDLRGTATLAH